jgi:hypothetical protein
MKLEVLSQEIAFKMDRFLFPVVAHPIKKHPLIIAQLSD